MSVTTSDRYADGVEEDRHQRSEPSTSERDDVVARAPPTPQSKHRRNGKEVDKRKERDVHKLLLYEEREAKHLRDVLKETATRLEMETSRSKEAETHVSQVIAKMKAVDLARQQAQMESTRIAEELQMYKVQYENMKKELERAQTEYNKLAELKNVAEDVASAAKREARQLKTERLMEKARSEGIQIGIERGYRRAMDDGYFRGGTRQQERARDMEVENRTTPDTEDFVGQRLEDALREQQRPRPTPNRALNLSRSTDRSLNDATFPRPMVAPVSAIRDEGGAPESEYGHERQARPFSPQRSVRAISPAFDNPLLPEIPTIEDDGRITMPPPHHIDPNRALSPSTSAMSFQETTRNGRPDDEGDMVVNGAPYNSLSRMSAGIHRPTSQSSASTHISNFNIVHDIPDENEQDPSLLRRSVPLRSAASPGLSVIMEGSNADASSPGRQLREIDGEQPIVPSPQWNGGGAQWNEPDNVDQVSQREGIRSPMSRNSISRSRPQSTRSPFAATVQDFPDDPVSHAINQQVSRNSERITSPWMAEEQLSRRGSPASDLRRARSERSIVGTPRSRGHNRTSSFNEPLPEISVLPPSRPLSFDSGNEMAEYIPQTQMSPNRAPSPIYRAPSPARPISPAIPTSARNSIHIQHVARSPSPQFFPPPESFAQDFEVNGAITPRARSPFLGGGPPPSPRAVVPSPTPSRSRTPMAQKPSYFSRSPQTSSFDITTHTGRPVSPTPSGSRTPVIPPTSHFSRTPQTSSFDITTNTGRPASQVFAPTPRHPRPLSINSSSSGSPQRIMPQLTPEEMDEHNRRRNRNSLMSSVVGEDDWRSQGRPKSRASRISAVNLSRAPSQNLGGMANPSYVEAPIPDDVVYPAPPGENPMPIASSSRPKSILRNSRTPAATSHDLPNFEGGTSLSRARSPMPRSPQPNYEPAPGSENIVYPSPLGPPPPVPGAMSGLQPFSDLSSGIMGGGMAPRSPMQGQFAPPLGPPPQTPRVMPTLQPFAGTSSNAMPTGIGGRSPLQGQFAAPLGPPPQASGVMPGTPGVVFPRSPQIGTFQPGSVFPKSPAAFPQAPGRTSQYVPAQADENDAGPVHPFQTPGNQPQSLTERWLGLTLPPSTGVAANQPLPPSAAPSMQTLNTPWHPSQHLASGNRSPNQRASPNLSGLPPVTGPLGRPFGF